MCKVRERASVSRRTLPEWIRRSRLVDAGSSSSARICCLRDSADVVLGLGIERMTSGFDVEKRMTRSNGTFDAAIVAYIVGSLKSHATKVRRRRVGSQN